VHGLAPLGWLGILRLGLIQTALGAIVILTTSTLNRVMVIELALPATLPGALVAAHYAVQFLRPRLGYGSDLGGRRTPWIIGGMAVLALGGVAAALATALMETQFAAGLVLAVIAFIAIGVGVGATGTTLLVLLAKRVAPERRAAAATIVWVMMIAGFVVTAGLAGHFLDPYSPARLVAVVAAVSLAAFLLTVLAVRGVEAPAGAPPEAAAPERRTPFRAAFREVWAEPEARAFTVFVFVSMLAYSMQDLILEPFAGIAFGMSVGETTRLSGLQNGGVLAGMLTFAVVASLFRGRRLGGLWLWTITGCIGSACALFALAAAPSFASAATLGGLVFLLGFANGTFAVAAIGSMMGLVARGRSGREGVRMGLWGAAQAIAFGLGGVAGTVLADLASHLLEAQVAGYALVLAIEGVLFLAAATLALRMVRPAAAPRRAAGPAYADAVADAVGRS
jgi:BCD family chlorophyll transporter-like MFS transporter